MSSVEPLSPSTSRTPRFSIEADGLTFPVPPAATEQKTMVPGVKKPDRQRLPVDRLVSEIVHSLWPTLPFLDGEQAGFRDMEPLVDAYSQSWARLDAAWDEVQHLAEVVCRINIEVQAEQDVNEPARDKAVARTFMKSIEGIPGSWVPPWSPLTADLVERPLDEAQAVLRDSLWQATHQLASQILDVLNLMVGAERLGVIRWSGPTSCEIHFFREIVIQRHKRTEEILGTRHTEIIHDAPLRRIQRTRQEVTTVTSGDHEHRHARYGLHLMHASSSLLEYTPTMIPARFQPVAQAVPDWLRPLVEVVDGKRFRQQIVSTPVSTEGYAESQTRVDSEEVVLRPDPAILLGNRYVLTGWGPEEMEGEQERQAAVARQESEQQRRRTGAAAAKLRGWATIALLVQALGLILAGAGAVMWPALQVLGWIVALIGLIPVDEAVRAEVVLRRIVVMPQYRFYAVASAAILVFALQFLAAGYVATSWGMVVAGLLLLGPFVASIRWTLACREPQCTDSPDDKG